MPDPQDSARPHSALPLAALPPGVPRDYAITVPGTWALIPLDPGLRYKAISSLIQRQFAGTPGGNGVRAALRRHLTDLAETGHG